MSMSEFPIEDPLVFYDISPPEFAGLSQALPEDCLHYFSGEQSLEVTNRVIRNVSWEAYEAILEVFGDRRFRHTYADGTLEMMSPTEEHEWLTSFLGQLVAIVAYEFNLPIKSVGATTRRKRKKSRGLEPDESFFVQHEQAVRGRRSRSSTKGPPPDLAIEVEITHKEVDRLDAYEKLGVPEVWRYRDDVIEFFLLQATGGYLPIPRSVALPLIQSSQLTELLSRLDSADETTLMHEFIATLRNQPKPDSSI